MPLRETRRFKTRGVVISFGDFMLPLVGIVAIGLLLVAGKIFFFSDFQLEALPIPDTVAPPASRPQANPAPAAANRPPANVNANARPSAPPQSGAQPSQQRPSAGGNLVLDLDQGNNSQVSAVAVPVNTNRNDAPRSGESSRTEEIIVVTPSLPQQPKPRPAMPSRPVNTAPAPPPAQARPAQPVQPAKPAAQPANTNWMVQIGAFSTRAAANAVLQQITKSGHTAAVVSGKTLHRVLVQSGPTKQEALDLATRLGQSNFPGAFVVPPRS